MRMCLVAVDGVGVCVLLCVWLCVCVCVGLCCVVLGCFESSRKGLLLGVGLLIQI